MNQEVYAQVVDTLFRRHYGISINDTLLSEERYLRECMEHGQKPYEAVNEVANKWDLDRIDGRYGERRRPLTPNDERAAMPAHAAITS